MMDCNFKVMSIGHVVCKRCGRLLKTNDPPERCHAMCRIAGPKPKPQVCHHRGPELRRVECPTCSGNVQVKVFGCAVFAECTIAKPLPGIQCCEACPRYQAGESATASATGG